MKKIILFCFVFCCIATQLQANNLPNTTLPQDDDITVSADLTNISLWIPGCAFKIGSWFVSKHHEPELKYALKNIGTVRLLVKSGKGESPRLNRKMNRWQKRLDRKGFEDLMAINTDDTFINIKLRDNNKGRIKNFALMVNGEEDFVLAHVKSRIELKKLLDAFDQDWIDVNVELE